MKKILFLVCLLSLALSASGREHITHDLRVSSTYDSFTSENTVANLKDGTVYTCTGGNFLSKKLGTEETATINIQLPQNAEVVVTPKMVGLQEMEFAHYPNSVNLTISLSTDGVNWLVAGTDVGRVRTSSGFITIDQLQGDYFIKIKNSSPTVVNYYIRQADYYLEPVSCPNCFPVVFDE